MRSPTYSPAQKAAAIRITRDRPPNIPTAVWLQWLKSDGIDPMVLALVEDLTAVHEYLLELEAQSLIERTGEFRDGEPVWTATARGRAEAHKRQRLQQLKVKEKVH